MIYPQLWADFGHAGLAGGKPLGAAWSPVTARTVTDCDGAMSTQLFVVQAGAGLTSCLDCSYCLLWLDALCWTVDVRKLVLCWGLEALRPSNLLHVTGSI